MQKKFQRYTVTAALPYANGGVHIGHLAGVYIPADIYCRYLRLKSEDVLFVCGSDEHGVPVTIRAAKEGITVQEVVDKYDKIIGDSFKEFGISFDIYSRTSKPIHYETSQEIFKNLYDKQVFLEETSEQYFDPIANKFLADRYIVGTCPVCNNTDAYGDQCENCGTSLTPDKLINPRSKLSDAIPTKKETKHWYFPLDKYETWLKEWILEGHKDWKTNVYGQCKSWLDAGLQPRPMTRDLDWGIPLPIPHTEGKVMYVWFDAPIGYISATKDYFAQKNADVEAWKAYWQDENTKLVHFIGKDNIVFHCIIFPAILKAEGSYILPENVPANEFLNLEDAKISTSRNWAVWLDEYLREFEGKQDVLRYVLTANAPENKDNNFTWKDFQDKNNNELVANLGNFVNRVLTLTQKYFEGLVPPLNDLEKVDIDLMENLKIYPHKIGESIENYRFREALGYIMELSSVGNKYFQENEPWKLAKDFKTNEKRIENILHLALQLTANLAFLVEPFLPFTAQKLQKALRLGKFYWNELGKEDLLISGQKIEQVGLLFEKIEDETIQKQLQKLEDSKKMNELDSKKPQPLASEITYDDFAKLDMRVATILKAEKMPKSDKLLKLLLDTGIDERVVLSGIAKHFSPEEILGRQVCVLCNLAPRKMMGEISNGMILMAEDKDGSLKFVEPSASVWNGAKIS
ncbi:MAG: methionine--tRNA ligase [Thermonemataceae bacterium]|nr:methionine--tRNA ligase [Thermonemataceae bacterium]